MHCQAFSFVNNFIIGTTTIYVEHWKKIEFLHLFDVVCVSRRSFLSYIFQLKLYIVAVIGISYKYNSQFLKITKLILIVKGLSWIKSTKLLLKF